MPAVHGSGSPRLYSFRGILRAEDGFIAADSNGYGSGSAVGQDDLARRRLRRTS